MDLLDFLNIRDKEVCTGTYYDMHPETPQDDGKLFSYEIASSRDVSYYNLITNLNTEQATQMITTNDLQGFRVKGYCALQDGGLWQIMNYVRKPAKSEDSEVLRILKHTSSVEYVIRLVQVDNAWGLE